MKDEKENATIKNAINIDKGAVVKVDIPRFQNRQKNYPHSINNKWVSDINLTVWSYSMNYSSNFRLNSIQ